MAAPSWMRGQPRKILVATDLSARCDRALDRALSLAGEWKAEVVAVHVLDPSSLLPPDEIGMFSSWRHTSEMRRLIESRVRAEFYEIAPDLTVVIETGDPAEAICRTARTHGADLIVTGVARNELLGRIALGNTVARLARQSEIPVLVVRKRGRRPYRHIVVATDFSESSRHALEAVVQFLPSQRLTLFHAFDTSPSLMVSDMEAHRALFREAATRDGREFLKAFDLSNRPGGMPELVLEEGDPDRRLYEYVAVHDVDLVALGTHGRSAIFHVLIGSVAQSLIESLPCDVLVVREPKSKPE